MDIIYILENKINGKKYVGQTTKSLEERIINHKSKNSLIGKAIRKYGIENFHKTIIEISYDKLNQVEIDKIKELNSLFPFGYNLSIGGEGVKNPSEEIRKKISNSKLGKSSPRKGVKLSEETKLKISLARKKNYKINIIKVCASCKHELDFSSFYKDRHNKDGLSVYCKECVSLKNKNSYVKRHVFNQSKVNKEY